jgi:hypothetical protein
MDTSSVKNLLTAMKVECPIRKAAIVRKVERSPMTATEADIKKAIIAANDGKGDDVAEKAALVSAVAKGAKVNIFV